MYKSAHIANQPRQCQCCPLGNFYYYVMTATTSERVSILTAETYKTWFLTRDFPVLPPTVNFARRRRALLSNVYSSITAVAPFGIHINGFPNDDLKSKLPILISSLLYTEKWVEFSPFFPKLMGSQELMEPMPMGPL